MATQTPNLGLTLPVGTENVSRQVINGNNTLIDTFAGQMGSNLGILETGDTATHAIAKGEYVTWKGASYTADAAISIGETLAATGGSKNLTACDKGIGNALNSKITNKFPSTFYPTKNTSYIGTTFLTAVRVGSLVNVSGRFQVSTKKPAGQENYLFTGLPSPQGQVIPASNNIMILNSSGNITSNDAVETGWYNISITYVC